jgi:hypothetical protein
MFLSSYHIHIIVPDVFCGTPMENNLPTAVEVFTK